MFGSIGRCHEVSGFVCRTEFGLAGTVCGAGFPVPELCGSHYSLPSLGLFCLPEISGTRPFGHGRVPSRVGRQGFPAGAPFSADIEVISQRPPNLSQVLAAFPRPWGFLVLSPAWAELWAGSTFWQVFGGVIGEKLPMAVCSLGLKRPSFYSLLLFLPDANKQLQTLVKCCFWKERGMFGRILFPWYI